MTAADRIALRLYSGVALNVGAGLCAGLVILIMTTSAQTILDQWFGYVAATVLTGSAFRMGVVLGFKAEL